MSLYCTSEDFNLSIWSSLVCNMNRKQEKKNTFSKVKLPLCLSIHFPNLAPKTMLMFEYKCCARSTPTTSPKNWTKWNFVPRQGNQQRKEQEVRTTQALERLSSTQTALSKLFYQWTSGKIV